MKEMIIDSVRISSATDEFVVNLKQKDAPVYLAIFLGRTQAERIAVELLKQKPDGDEDYVLTLDGYDRETDRVEAAVVTGLANGVYQARLDVSSANGWRSLVCPLATAVALAAREKAPILVEDSVLAVAAVDISLDDVTCLERPEERLLRQLNTLAASLLR
jgi:bifunctional DNase/RNase